MAAEGMNEQFKELYSREYGSDIDLDIDEDDEVGEIPPAINQLCGKSKSRPRRRGKKKQFDYEPEHDVKVPSKYYEEVASESDDDLELVDMDTRRKNDDGLDCESILSKCSNLYNHPKLIVEPRPGRVLVDTKSGIPEVSTKLTSKNLKQLAMDDTPIKSSDLASNVSLMSVRNRNESKEEKKARKNLVKEHRRERRIERKLNESAFKEEKKKQDQEARNARPGVRLA